MAYLKPQTPLKDLNSGDYFYPLTTIDQIITGTSRLSAFLSEDNNLLNLSNIGNLSVNGTSYFANTITGDILSAWHILAGRPSNTTNFRTYFETVANLHHENPNRTDSEMSYNRWFASNSDQTTYGPSALNLPVVDQHVLSFGIDNGAVYSRHIALDIRTNKMFLGGRVNNTWQNWSEVIVNDLDQTITGVKTFNGQVYFNNNMHWKISTNWICDTTTDNTEWSFDIGNSTNTGNYWQVWSAKNSATILSCYNDNRHVMIPVHLAVGGYNNTSYSLSTASFICNSWIRTKGSTGWYNEDYDGGWYMSDGDWIRSYKNKSVYSGDGQIRSDNCIWGNRVCLSDNYIGFYGSTAGGTRYGFIQTDSSKMYFRKENGNNGFDFNGKITINKNSWSTASSINNSIIEFERIYHARNDSNREYNVWIAGRDSINDWGYGNTICLGAYHRNVDDCGFYIGTSWDDNNSDRFFTFSRFGDFSCNRVYNAVWNDFAEYREGDITEPGRVVAVTESSNIVTKTIKRLQPCAHIISDTFGCSVGQSDTAKTPVGVAGRVLVYPYQDISNYKIGDCLCAAPNGTADIMSREEIISYPDRIIGIVDEIPTYEYWNQTLTTNKEGDAEYKVQTEIKVNGRIWVYVR